MQLTANKYRLFSKQLDSTPLQANVNIYLSNKLTS